MVNRAGHPGAPLRPNGPNQNQQEAQARVINLALQQGIISQDQVSQAQARRLRYQTAHSNQSDRVPGLLEFLLSPQIVADQNSRNALNQLIEVERQRIQGQAAANQRANFPPPPPALGDTNLAFQVPASQNPAHQLRAAGFELASGSAQIPNADQLPGANLAVPADSLGMGFDPGLFGSAFNNVPLANPLPQRTIPTNPPRPSLPDPRIQFIADLQRIRAQYSTFNDTSKYSEIEELGAGAMGRVLKVRDKILNRDAALKLILGQAGGEAIERFRREARITAKLEHPSIPSIFEAGTNEHGQDFLIMRIIDGNDFNDVIKDFHSQENVLRVANIEDRVQDRRNQIAYQKKLEVFNNAAPGTLEEPTEPEPSYQKDFSNIDNLKEIKELIEKLIKVAEALSYSHSLGILHRDIKPANMMVGQFGEALMMDWGLAKDLNNINSDDIFGNSQVIEAEQDLSLTRSRDVLGTPLFMSPEHIKGLEIDERDEVFSLGVCLSNIITGKHPITAKTIAEVAQKLDSFGHTIDPETKEKIPHVNMPLDYNKTVPSELNAIVKKAMAKEKKDRFKNVAKFIDALKTYLAGEDLSPDIYEYTKQEKRQRYLKRNANKLAVYALGSSLAVVLVGGGAGYTIVSSRAEREKLAKEKALSDKARAEADKKNLELERNQAVRLREEIQRTKRDLIEANGLLALASLDQEKGRTGEMERRISAALEKYPIRQFYAQAAGIYNNAGKYGSAIRNYKEALELAREEEKNGSKDAKNSIYDYLYKTHVVTVERSGKTGYVETEAMKELMAEAQKRGDENEFTLLFKANKIYDSDNFRESERLLLSAIEKNPNLFALHNDLGNTYLKLGEVEKALAAFDQAVEVGRKVYFTYFNRAVARKNLISSGFYGKPKTSEKARSAARSAINDYNEAIRLKTNLEAGLSYIGEVYQITGEDAQALACFDESIRKFPNFSMAHLNSGSIYFAKAIGARNLRDVPKAIIYLNEAQTRFTNAARLKPESTMVAFNLGNAYKTLADIEISQNEKEKAIESYKKAKANYSKAIKLGETNGHDQNSQFACATRAVTSLALAQHGDPANRTELYEEALSGYQKFVKLLPDHPESTGIHQIIIKLKRALGR